MSETPRHVPSQEGGEIKKRELHSAHRIHDLKGDPIGEGGNSRAYEVKGHPDQILLQLVTGFFMKTPENLQRAVVTGNFVKERMAELPEDVQAARILEAFTEDGEYFELQERAAGKPLHDRDEETEEWLECLQALANAPLDQYKKMIRDLRAITDVGLEVDPSKPDNIFYDADAGFTYIDLTIPTREAVAYSPFVQLVYGYSRKAQFTEEANTAIRTITKKLREAGDAPEDLGSSFEAVQTWMEKKKGTPDEIVDPSPAIVATEEDGIW